MLGTLATRTETSAAVLLAASALVSVIVASANEICTSIDKLSESKEQP